MKRLTGRASAIILLAAWLFSNSAAASHPDILRNYRFIPSRSTLDVTGGFAGIDETFHAFGKFGLVTGYEEGVSCTALGCFPTHVPFAEFVDVDAWLVPESSSERLPSRPRRPLAQNTHPTAQPTCVDTHTAPTGITTVTSLIDFGSKEAREAAVATGMTDGMEQSYQLLDELYGNVVGQWGRYNGHVVGIVGGAYTQERYGTGPRFTPVERERQREAVRFLNANVFHAPEWILDEAILRRLEAEGTVARIRGAQVRVLSSLLAGSRLDRLVEYEALADDPAALADAAGADVRHDPVGQVDDLDALAGLDRDNFAVNDEAA